MCFQQTHSTSYIPLIYTKQVLNGTTFYLSDLPFSLYWHTGFRWVPFLYFIYLFGRARTILLTLRTQIGWVGSKSSWSVCQALSSNSANNADPPARCLDYSNSLQLIFRLSTNLNSLSYIKCTTHNEILLTVSRLRKRSLALSRQSKGQEKYHWSTL